MIIVTCLAALIATIALGVIFYFCYLFYCWKKQQNINTGLLAYYHSGYSFLKIRAIPIEKWEQIKAIIASEYALDKDRFQLETFYSIPGEVLTARIDAKIIHILYFTHFFDYIKMLCWYVQLRRNGETIEQKREYAKKRKDQKEFYQLVATIGQENVNELNNIINNNINNINNNLATIKGSLE